MASKGSKYARKHNIEEPEVTRNEFEGEPFYEVISNDDDFLDVFNSLPLSDQIKAYQVLKNLAETNPVGLPKDEKKLIAKSEYKLETINLYTGLTMEEMLRYPLSSDERHVIRMDFYGSVDLRPSHQLSTFYKDMINKPLSEKCNATAYKLEKAPMWKIFRQFANFRKIEPNIKQYLSDNMINPDILKIMSVKDFSDVIFKAFQKDNEYKVSFSNRDSERNAFVKSLVNEKSDAIFDILNHQGHDHRYIHSLLNAMKTYGITDTYHLIITETYFTEKTLSDLRSAKIPVDDFNVGDKIPQTLMNDLFKQDKGHLIIARDENMEILSSANFPTFEVHHKIAVSESGKLPLLAQVNYKNNFVLVESNIHQKVLHGYDQLLVQKDKEAYHCRMEFVDECLSFMAGFTPDTQLSVNWTYDEDLSRKADEDAKYIVSYEECLRELNKNRDEYNLDKRSVKDFDAKDIAKSIRVKCSTKKKPTKKPTKKSSTHNALKLIKNCGFSISKSPKGRS